MTSCLSNTLSPQHGLLDHIMPILREHLYATVMVAVMLVAAICLRLRRRQQKSLPDTESWMEDDKPLFTLPPSLPELISEYSHPLAQALFQQSGIPTSGDLAQRELLNSTSLAHGPFPISIPTSGDLAAMAAPTTLEEQRHPWRRHSYPERQCSEGNLNRHQRDAVITEDALEFFKDDKIGKLWRRRTLEFGSAQ